MSDRAAAERLWRDAERVADRLGVVGPRMERRSSEQARELLADIRARLQDLADVACDGEGVRRRQLPELAARGLADQLLVLAHDITSLAPPTVAAAEQIVTALRALI